MIRFTNIQDNTQYVSVLVSEGVNISALISKLKTDFPSIQPLHFIFDSEELLMPIVNNCNYDFSLNQLREYLKPVATTVSHFCADMGKPTQRYYG